MRTIQFRHVFDRTVRLHGRDSRKNIPSDLRNAIIDHINDRVRTICQGWRWPEWEVTEERAFRQVWNATHAYLRVSLVDGQPDEVFYLGTGFIPGASEFGTDFGYYRVLKDAASDPPVGTLPTDTDFFESIDPLETFVAYDQGCKRSIGIIRGMFAHNPILSCAGNGAMKYMPTEKGIKVCCVGSPTVFIKYSMPVPNYTMTPWVLGKVYARADIVFDHVTGECFQALTATSNAVTHADWAWIPFPDKWADYVGKGAFADSLMEFDQGGNSDLQAKDALTQYWSQKADDALQLEVDALVTQGQKLRWNFCRPRCSGEWLVSLPWDGGSVTTLTDACDTEPPVFPFPVVTEGCDTTYHSEIISRLTADGTPSLEGLNTTTRAITCTLVTIVINVDGSPEVQSYRLDTGPADPLDPGQISPSDYDASTNNKHWTQVQ